MDMVTIIVDGKPVQVPGHTNSAEIRRLSRCGPSCPLARVRDGRNVIAAGDLDVLEGDRFIVGRSFSKGRDA